jgi:hypothetical protein
VTADTHAPEDPMKIVEEIAAGAEAAAAGAPHLF